MTQENFQTITLDTLLNVSRPKKRTKLLGRGPGSGHGKTSCRGHKGAGSRSGYKARHGKEGGGVPLYRRIPSRGFSNARFARKFDVVNLAQIERIYQDGETVSLESLRERGLISGASYGVKVLGTGTLEKKLFFQVEAFSSSAQEKLNNAGIETGN